MHMFAILFAALVLTPSVSIAATPDSNVQVQPQRSSKLPFGAESIDEYCAQLKRFENRTNTLKELMAERRDEYLRNLEELLALMSANLALIKKHGVKKFSEIHPLLPAQLMEAHARTHQSKTVYKMALKESTKQTALLAVYQKLPESKQCR